MRSFNFNMQLYAFFISSRNISISLGVSLISIVSAGLIILCFLFLFFDDRILVTVIGCTSFLTIGLYVTSLSNSVTSFTLVDLRLCVSKSVYNSPLSLCVFFTLLLTLGNISLFLSLLNMYLIPLIFPIIIG